jgi:hypothetical protein
MFKLLIMYKLVALVLDPPKAVFTPRSITAEAAPVEALAAIPASVELTPDSPQWPDVTAKHAAQGLTAVNVLVEIEPQEDKFVPTKLEVV